MDNNQTSAIASAMLSQIKETYKEEDVDNAILVCTAIVKMLCQETVILHNLGEIAITMKNPLPVLDKRFPDCLRIVANVIQARIEADSK